MWCWLVYFLYCFLEIAQATRNPLTTSISSSAMYCFNHSQFYAWTEFDPPYATTCLLFCYSGRCVGSWVLGSSREVGGNHPPVA